MQTGGCGSANETPGCREPRAPFRKLFPPLFLPLLCRPLAHGTDDHRGRDCEGQDGQEEWGCMQLHCGLNTDPQAQQGEQGEWGSSRSLFCFSAFAVFQC